MIFREAVHKTDPESSFIADREANKKKHAEIILSAMEKEYEPLTAWELWHRHTGLFYTSGIDVVEIRKRFLDLEINRLVTTNRHCLKKCTVKGKKALAWRTIPF